MQCPACKDKTLVMTERQGVEIDYCPSCRGIWLDRGELDKILERSESSPPAPSPAEPPRPQRKPDDSDFGMVYQDEKGRPVYYKKRKSILRELLDF